LRNKKPREKEEGGKAGIGWGFLPEATDKPRVEAWSGKSSRLKKEETP